MARTYLCSARAPLSDNLALTSDRQDPSVFLLVFALLLSFCLLGALGGRLPLLTAQPIGALMAFVPMVTALIHHYRAHGLEGATNLFKHALDLDRVQSIRWHLVPACLLPIVAVLQYAVLQLVKTELPAPKFAPAATPVFFVMCFIGAIGAEVGWHCLHIIPLRMIIVRLFVNTGQSAFIAVLFHTMINLPWSLIENYGSFYDLFVTFVILMVVIGVVVLQCDSTRELLAKAP